MDDARELARLLSPLGYPPTAEDVEAVWHAGVADGDFALMAEGEHSLLGAITLDEAAVR